MHPLPVTRPQQQRNGGDRIQKSNHGRSLGTRKQRFDELTSLTRRRRTGCSEPQHSTLCSTYSQSCRTGVTKTADECRVATTGDDAQSPTSSNLATGQKSAAAGGRPRKIPPPPAVPFLSVSSQRSTFLFGIFLSACVKTTRSSAMSKKVLIVLTSAKSSPWGKDTGYWLEEVLVSARCFAPA